MCKWYNVWGSYGTPRISASVAPQSTIGQGGSGWCDVRSRKNPHEFRAHLFLHLLVPQVHFHMESGGPQSLPHRLCVLIRPRADWHHHDLPGAEPERPLLRKMFCENCKHALHRPEDGPMHNHRPLRLLSVVPVVQVEPDRQLEVQLDGGTLRECF